MDSYYSLLGVASDASATALADAYRYQCERYAAERVVGLDAEFERIAAERRAELDRAYATLSDPVRRAAYDSTLGLTALPAPRARPRTSRREWLMLLGGALAGLLLIAVVALLSGRAAQPALPPVAMVDRPAPPFTLLDLAGREVRLADYRGKVVMLNFWWTGCAPCAEETPALQAAYRTLADQGLVILGVNVREQERSGADGLRDIQRFSAKYQLTYPIILDAEGAVGRDYQVLVLPTTVFIDQHGVERFRSFSTVTTEDVERIFRELQRGVTAQR